MNSGQDAAPITTAHGNNHWAGLILVLSAVGFIVSLYLFSDANDSPVNFPIPASGMSVSSPIDILTSGDFKLIVSVPYFWSSPDAHDSPAVSLPVTCVRVYGGTSDGIKMNRVLEEFRPSGLNSFGKQGFFESAAFHITARDTSFITIENCDTNSVASLSGMISMRRDVPSVEHLLLAKGIRLTAWVLLAVGIVLIVIQKNRFFVGRT